VDNHPNERIFNSLAEYVHNAYHNLNKVSRDANKLKIVHC